MANKLYPYSFSSRQALYVMVSGPYSLEMTEGLQLKSWMSVTGSMQEVKKISAQPEGFASNFVDVLGELRPAKVEIELLESLGWAALNISGVLRPAYVEIEAPNEGLAGGLTSTLTGIFKLASTSMEMAPQSLIGDFLDLSGDFFISAKFGIEEDLALTGLFLTGNLRPGYLDTSEFFDLAASLSGVSAIFEPKLIALAAPAESLTIASVTIGGQMYSPVVDIDANESLSLTHASVSGQMTMKVQQIQEAPAVSLSALSLDGSLRSTIVYTDSDEALIQGLTSVSGTLQEMLRKISSPESLCTTTVTVTGDLVLKQKSIDALDAIVPSVSVSGIFRENIVFVEATEGCLISGITLDGALSFDPGLRVVLFDTLKTEPGPGSLTISFTNLKD